ncbi:MAG: ribosomal protein S18-alanine N-acetyltransferase [bacterium]|nr:MAG: ribosomal protein S18-alanine N-acetyltransferase [bacterium]
MSCTDFLVRWMVDEDLGKVMEIEQVSFPTPWTEYMFQCQLRLKDISINLVAVRNDIIDGYATAWVAAEEIHLLSIAVRPESRREGCAETLLGAVIEQGRDRGGSSVILEVRIGNIEAQRFYEKHGFRVVGRRQRYYRETGEDALVMELVLDR